MGSKGKRSRKTPEQRAQENFKIQTLLDEGQTIEEISNVTGIAAATIEKRKQRGLAPKNGNSGKGVAVAGVMGSFSPGYQISLARDILNDIALILKELVFSDKKDSVSQKMLLDYLKEIREQIKTVADVSQQIDSAQAQKEFETAVANVLQKVSPEARQMLTAELRLLRENRMVVSS